MKGYSLQPLVAIKPCPSCGNSLNSALAEASQGEVSSQSITEIAEEVIRSGGRA